MEASPLPPTPKISFQSRERLRSYHRGERMSGELGWGACAAIVRRRVRWLCGRRKCLRLVGGGAFLLIKVVIGTRPTPHGILAGGSWD